jgi:hypothetical protein
MNLLRKETVNNLIGGGFDGASSMLGVKNGLSVLI